ncbi:MAG: tRNA (cytidine(34)-2'-O)-methyltransferase [Acidobacteriota bacterium]
MVAGVSDPSLHPAVDAADFHVVLVEPQIPPNTGNVARLCAALEIPLHLVGRLGFSLEDRYLRRAGLDYWPYVDLRLWPDAEAFFARLPADRLHWFSRHAGGCFWDCAYARGDVFVFGSEISGLPGWLREAYPGRGRRLPMRHPQVRSLNLASAVAAAVYEGMRQLRSRGLSLGNACDTTPGGK